VTTQCGFGPLEAIGERAAAELNLALGAVNDSGPACETWRRAARADRYEPGAGQDVLTLDAAWPVSDSVAAIVARMAPTVS
jgi:hypothetical protein